MEMLISGLALSAGFLLSLGAMFFDLRTRSPFFVFWGFVLLFFNLPIAVGYVSEQISYSLILEMCLFQILCIFVYTATTVSLPNISIKCSRDIFVNDSFSKKAYYVTFFSYLTLLAISFVDSFYSYDYKFYTSFTILFYLNVFFIPAIFYFYKRKNFVLSFVGFLAYLLFVKISQSRGDLAFLFLPLFYFLLLKGFFSGFKSVYAVLIIVLIACISLLVRAYRWSYIVGDGVSWDHFLRSIEYIFSNILIDGELSLIFFFVNGIDMCREQEAVCFNFSIVQKALFAKIFMYDVLTPPYQIANYVVGDDKQSFHPTVFGTVFLDGGYFGVVYFFFLGILRNLAQKLIESGFAIVLLPALFYFILFCSRGSIYNGVAPLVVVLFSIFLFVFMRSISRVK